MNKPLLYIDVDGVLFGFYDGYFQLRPNVNGFLAHCVAHFRCRWLTSWSPAMLDRLATCTYLGPMASQVVYTRWDDWSFKAMAIDPTSDFYWIEDGISERDRGYLAEYGVLDRYLEVNHEGRDELERVWQELALHVK